MVSYALSASINQRSLVSVDVGNCEATSLADREAMTQEDRINS
jgi:hypothetical protein